MQDSVHRLVIQQQNLADYRIGFYQTLQERLEGSYILICGNDSLASGQKSIADASLPQLLLRNLSPLWLLQCASAFLVLYVVSRHTKIYFSRR